MQTVLFSKFRYLDFVTEHKGWLWKYIILLIYKTNFDSSYLMFLYTRHVVTTKPSGTAFVAAGKATLISGQPG